MSQSRQKELESKLTLQQRNAALLIVENELSEGETKRSQEELAEEIGVMRKTLYNWRTQNKAFIEYVNILADDFLSSKRAVVYRQLMKSIEGSQPSIKAIDLFMRRFALLTDRQVTESNEGNDSRSNDDIAKDLAELDGLLDEEDNTK